MLAVALAALSLNLASAPALEDLADKTAASARLDTLEAPLGLWVTSADTAGLGLPFSAMMQRRLAQAQKAPVRIEANDGLGAEAESRAQRLRALVRVTVTVDSRGLYARGDVVSTWSNFWSGASRQGPAPILSTLNVFVPHAPAPKPYRPWALAPWLELPSVPLALASRAHGGVTQLAVAFSDSVATYVWGAARASASSPLAPLRGVVVPTRDPVARFEDIDGGLRLWASTLERAGRIPAGDNLSIDIDTTVDAGFPGSPVPGRNAFLADALRDAPWTNTSTACGHRLDVYATGIAALTVAGGTTRFSAGAGSLVWETADHACWLLSTLAKVAEADDELRIWAVDHGTVAPQPAATLFVPSGAVLSTAAGDFDGDGALDIAVGLERPNRAGAVWLLRGGSG